MFVDEADIVLRAGHGGAGKVSFFPGLKSGPDGGNGGKGADIYVRATTDITVLRQFTTKRVITAQNGEAGQSNRKFGKDGKDTVVLLPIGSVIKNQLDNQAIELTKPDEKILICKGGLGGRGNFEFKSSRKTTPMYAQPGLPGEEKHLQIVLKLIADFGLIGLPNAGKSSLLNALTKTDVKTAAYPFTTLEPNLGVLDKKIFADIPGLIEGASSGKGLGIKFLKHIEKTDILLHCIAADSPDVRFDYQTVINELKAFSENLVKKSQIILLTKSDLVTKQQLKEALSKLKTFKHKIIAVSIHDWDSLEALKQVLFQTLEDTKS